MVSSQSGGRGPLAAKPVQTGLRHDIETVPIPLPRQGEETASDLGMRPKIAMKDLVQVGCL